MIKKGDGLLVILIAILFCGLGFGIGVFSDRYSEMSSEAIVMAGSTVIGSILACSSGLYLAILTHLESKEKRRKEKKLSKTEIKKLNTNLKRTRQRLEYAKDGIKDKRHSNQITGEEIAIQTIKYTMSIEGKIEASNYLFCDNESQNIISDSMLAMNHLNLFDDCLLKKENSNYTEGVLNGYVIHIKKEIKSLIALENRCAKYLAD